MLKKHMIIGTYNHLPEGLDPAEFERIYQTCYRPFLSTLNRFPDIQASLHFSGGLLKWFEARHPEYLMLLEEMTARRQIELVGGGFYAPILPLIPNSDRLGQIEMLTTYLRKHFGKRPRGCWLSEYAWEPWLASTLQTSGMDYTFLSEAQFKAATGVSVGEFSPVITEDQGRCLTVLPVFDTVAADGSSLGFMEAATQAGSRALTVLMIPGESLRELWEASGLASPDLYMERTLAWLRKNSLDTETITPSRYLKTKKVTARLYFPGSATERFMRASATNDESQPCGSLRRSIIRYAGSAALYSRMYYVHLLIGQLRGDKSRKKTAIEDLWKGQCGDAYWLAPHGGLDQPAIREAAYRSLIDAEMTTRQKGAFSPGIVKADIDFDGTKEYIYQGSELNAYVHPRGAVLVELDLLKARRNLCDLFIAAPESDRARKTCFVDRMYAAEPDANRVLEPWSDDIGVFSTGAYDEAPKDGPQASLSFTKDGIVGIGDAKRSLTLSKRYSFNKKAVKVSYGVANRSDVEARLWFGVELNTSLGTDVFEGIETYGAKALAVNQADFSQNDVMVLEAVSRLTVKTQGVIKTLSLSSLVPARLQIAMIGGALRQGMAILLLWPLALAPDQVWHCDLVLSAHD